MYSHRTYREVTKDVLQKTVIVQAESDLQVFYDRQADGLHDVLATVRNIIEAMIAAHPEFQTSLVPTPTLLYAKEAQNPIIRDMILASNAAGVGPMAAVAGTVSKYVGEALLKANDNIIVENGGDLFLASDEERVVAIHAGTSPLSDKLGIVIPAEATPLGICTSSGTLGHSLSFGKADAAVIIAKDASLADAVATATGNRVKSEADLQTGIDFARSIPGVEFVAIIIEGKIAVWGDYALKAL